MEGIALILGKMNTLGTNKMNVLSAGKINTITSLHTFSYTLYI